MQNYRPASSVRDVDSLLQRHESVRDSSVRIEEMSRELSKLREELQSLETEMQTSPDTANFVPYRPGMSPCALTARWALCMGAGSVAAGVYTVAAGTRSATAPRLPTPHSVAGAMLGVLIGLLAVRIYYG